MNPVLLLVPLLAAWTLLGGGGGCSTAPAHTLIPFVCPTTAGTYHWLAEATGLPPPNNWNLQVPSTPVRDCEWNGVNDAGPLDVDEADGTNPHGHWDYFIAPDGTYDVTQFVWTHDAALEGQAWTWTRLDFAVVAGLTYRLHVERTDSVWSEGLYYFDLTCPGAALVEWYSWVGEPEPVWTAPETGTCRLEKWTKCARIGVDPLVPLDDVWCRDVWAVSR